MPQELMGTDEQTLRPRLGAPARDGRIADGAEGEGRKKARFLFFWPTRSRNSGSKRSFQISRLAFGAGARKRKEENRAPKQTFSLKDEVIYVAVGTNLKKERANILWVLQNFPAAAVILVHAHVASKMIPTLGAKFLASLASEYAVKNHRKETEEKMRKLMATYIDFIERRKVQVIRAVVTIKEDIFLGLQDLIRKLQIKKLVIDSRCISNQAAPLDCQICLVSKGKYISTREPSNTNQENDSSLEYWSALSPLNESDECLQRQASLNENEISYDTERAERVPRDTWRSSTGNATNAESRRQNVMAREFEELKSNCRFAQQRVTSMEQELDALRQENLALKNLQNCTEFSMSELVRATNNFHPSQKISEGGFGPVFKGMLCHTQVAIKLLKPESNQGPAEFHQEVLLLCKIRHPNIVILYGICQENSSLIYEYLPNGNLEDRLSCKDNTPPLSFDDRIRIISEQHSALVFLHSNAIIHADIKLANILLDANNVSRLGDFGTARLIPRDGSDTFTLCRQTNPMGTKGYMDPMFLTDGLLTSQSDVYSFGIVILRLLTGLPVLKIRERVEEGLRMGKTLQLLDASPGQCPVTSLEQLLKLALRCCSIERRSRSSLLSDEWRVLELLKENAGSRENYKKK